MNSFEGCKRVIAYTAQLSHQYPPDGAAAVEGAYACLEVVHSTWTSYRFNLAQNTADNSSAGQGVGADADGHPLDAVARELAANGQRLEAGNLVITDGLTAACALEVGGRLTAVFSSGNIRAVELAIRLN